jgi:hypothetical protein
MHFKPSNQMIIFEFVLQQGITEPFRPANQVGRLPEITVR